LKWEELGSNPHPKNFQFFLKPKLAFKFLFKKKNHTTLVHTSVNIFFVVKFCQMVKQKEGWQSVCIKQNEKYIIFSQKLGFQSNKYWHYAVCL
jgi:hypothetical protein